MKRALIYSTLLLGVSGGSEALAQLAAPSVEAFSPGSGAGLSAVFTATVSDPDGFADINIVNLLINTAVDGRNACYVAYIRSIITVVLVNDAGDAGGPFAGALTPGSGSASNLILRPPGWAASASSSTAGPCEC